MADPKDDQDTMEKQSHEFTVKQFAGKTSNTIPNWQSDLSSAIDVWLLREFYAWSQHKKTAFTVQDVDATSWWESVRTVRYELSTTYTGSLDSDLDQQATIVIEVSVHCGSQDDPKTLELSLSINGSKGPKVVYTSVGIVMTRIDKRKNKSFMISSNGQPHNCGS